MQNGGKLSHSEYKENGLGKGTWKMGNKDGKLRSHASSNVALDEKRRTEGTN
jgi:hypothetical protein